MSDQYRIKIQQTDWNLLCENKQTNNHQPGTVVVTDTGDLNFATTKPEINW